MADGSFIKKVCHFLVALDKDPPVKREGLDGLLKFWHAKAGVLWLGSKNTASIEEYDGDDHNG